MTKDTHRTLLMILKVMALAILAGGLVGGILGYFNAGAALAAIAGLVIGQLSAIVGVMMWEDS
ncbi:MAG: hypothetical protein K0Q92_620 [Steroidobacteraceae bacterium]|jgi:uncharacterized membrane protein (UPF0136 family)|nr:hypothetical protein [Steroidobacteraceae bacterium]